MPNTADAGSELECTLRPLRAKHTHLPPAPQEATWKYVSHRKALKLVPVSSNGGCDLTPPSPRAWPVLNGQHLLPPSLCVLCTRSPCVSPAGLPPFTCLRARLHPGLGAGPWRPECANVAVPVDSCAFVLSAVRTVHHRWGRSAIGMMDSVATLTPGFLSWFWG